MKPMKQCQNFLARKETNTKFPKTYVHIYMIAKAMRVLIINTKIVNHVDLVSRVKKHHQERFTTN
jgi:hypothetical protein